jgi:hypothetical protein
MALNKNLAKDTSSQIGNISGYLITNPDKPFAAPHPPPRASRVSHHPPQVSGLTLAHNSHNKLSTGCTILHHLGIKGTGMMPWNINTQIS